MTRRRWFRFFDPRPGRSVRYVMIMTIRIPNRLWLHSDASRLDRIENLHELSFTDLDTISRVLHLAIERLELLKETTEENQ